MAPDLPETRLNDDDAAFSATAVDHMGPLYIQKAYLIIIQLKHGLLEYSNSLWLKRKICIKCYVASKRHNLEQTSELQSKSNNTRILFVDKFTIYLVR